MRAWTLLALAGCRPLLHTPSPLHFLASKVPNRCRQDAQKEARPPVALLVDGDQIGPGWFGPAVAAAATRGPLRLARCFGAPHCKNSWSADLRRHGLEFVAVNRKGVREGDPNDLAIQEAAEALSEEVPEVQIGIATMDRDFIGILRLLERRGSRVFAVVPYLSDLLSFKRAQVDVVQFNVTSPATQRSSPSFAAAFEVRFDRPYKPEEAEGVFSAVGEVLSDRGYLRVGDRIGPTIRAMALFFHVHGMQKAQLYPWCVGAYEVHYESEARGASVLPSPGNLQFFEATAGRRRPGTGGRWAVLPRGEGLASRVLTWLGYEVRSKSSSGALEEELAAFWLQNAKALRLNLKDSALRMPLEFRSASERLAFLDQVFHDEAVRQQWRTAPEDGEIRAWLVRLGAIESTEAPRAEVFSALAERLAAQTGRRVQASYSLAVRLARESLLGRTDPLRRE